MYRENLEIDVSVIMSVYAEPIEWIDHSINSILTQTMREFELIIVNDKPDRSVIVELLKEYSQKDERIKIIANKQNIGLTKSINKGLKIARGRYIARMDADDFSLPNRLEEQVKYMKAHPNCVLCGTFANIINSKEKVVGKMELPVTNERIKEELLFCNAFIHPSYLFKNIGLLYNENIRYSQDYQFAIDISRNGELANIPKSFLCYRKSSNQISKAKLTDQNNCAHQIRMGYITSVLREKYGLNLDDKSIVQKVFEIIRKNPHDKVAGHILLSFGVFENRITLLERLKFVFAIKNLGWYKMMKFLVIPIIK